MDHDYKSKKLAGTERHALLDAPLSADGASQGLGSHSAHDSGVYDMKAFGLLSTIALILLSSCKDDGTEPLLSTGFSARIEVKTPGGAPVSGLRISVWNHLPPEILTKPSTENAGLALPLSASTIDFSVATKARIILTVSEFDGSPVSTLVDQDLNPGLYAVSWSNVAHTPPRVYPYRLLALDDSTGDLLFRDSRYAVLWHTDSDIAILGWTNSAGKFETSDSLFFPNVLNLPTLVYTGSQGPDSLNMFTFSDSVTIALTDTATNQHLSFERVIKKGVINEIQLIWNPPLPKRRAGSALPAGEPQAVIRTDQSTMGPFTWKLFQNYPNPFN